jgi:hypothetical protein
MRKELFIRGNCNNLPCHVATLIIRYFDFLSVTFVWRYLALQTTLPVHVGVGGGGVGGVD